MITYASKNVVAEFCECFKMIKINLIAQLAGAVEYTVCISTERYDALPNSVLDMTLNNLMVRLQ